MKINEIVNPHTPADRTFDSIAGVDTNEIGALYKTIIYVSDAFRISKYEAAAPDILQEFEDTLIIIAAGIVPGTTSYKMLQEI